MADQTQAEFLKDLEINPTEDVLTESLVEGEPEKTETPEEDEEKLRNRQARRLNERLQKEREANIDLNARLQTITESQKLRQGTETAEYLKMLEPIYGNSEPGKAEATELLKKAFEGMKESAKKEILEESEKQRQIEAQSQKKDDETLDELLISIEERFGVDLTDDTIARKGYLSLLQKLSPKDREGVIIEYADPVSTYEIFESRKEKQNVRAKELANRSMTRGGQSQGSKLEDDASVRFLKENGII